MIYYLCIYKNEGRFNFCWLHPTWVFITHRCPQLATLSHVTAILQVHGGLTLQGINMNQYPTVHGKIIDSKSAGQKKREMLDVFVPRRVRHLHRPAPYRFHTPKKFTTKTNQSLSPCAFNSVMLRIISSPGIPHWYISLGPGNAKLEADPPNLAFGKC